MTEAYRSLQRDRKAEGSWGKAHFSMFCAKIPLFACINRSIPCHCFFAPGESHPPISPSPALLHRKQQTTWKSHHKIAQICQLAHPKFAIYIISRISHLASFSCTQPHLPLHKTHPVRKSSKQNKAKQASNHLTIPATSTWYRVRYLTHVAAHARNENSRALKHVPNGPP